MVEANIKVTAEHKGSTGILSASQGESGSRTYRIEIYSGEGLLLDLTGRTAYFYVMQGKEAVQLPMENNGTDLSVTLSNGACRNPGDNPCWIQLLGPGGSELRVDNLILRVLPCEIDAAIEHSGDYSVLVRLIADTTQALTDTRRATEEAQTATASANSATTGATTAKAGAETAAGAANSAAAAASTQAGRANAAADAADAAADSANTQAGRAKAIADAWEGTDVAALGEKIDAAQSGVDAINSGKGTANGFAALTGAGKLAQMPTAEDVGAASIQQLMNAGLLGNSTQEIKNPLDLSVGNGFYWYFTASGGYNGPPGTLLGLVLKVMGTDSVGAVFFLDIQTGSLWVNRYWSGWKGWERIFPSPA